MDLEVVGRHALLFDDDASSAFVNSQEALVEWNSLLIDRYDVRHLLHTPPPPLKRRRPPPPSPTQSDIDHERFLDLPPPDSGYNPDVSSSLPESNRGAGSFNAVAFSYGNSDVSADQRPSGIGEEHSDFLPPFPVPESLLQNLPPTEKLHQIMARTAVFVSKHGGQSEIVLRVKQGDNPTFGFLMPDHQLHPYFRFLVEHPEVLNSGTVEDTKPDNAESQTADVSTGALSLLGSVYGSGEDEDNSLPVVNESSERKSGGSMASDSTHSHEPEQAEASLNLAGKDDEAPKRPLPSTKDKSLSSKRIRSVTAIHGAKKTEIGPSGSCSTSVNKPLSSTLPGTPKSEPSILEPPSDVKKTMDKIVEFILKNGKEFEAVLVEQDAKNGRFPFLLPSNRYHPYYLEVLKGAQESKQTGKSFTSQKIDTSTSKRAATSKGNDTASEVSASHDLPYDSEKKEKFKMVIGGPKKDAQDPPPKPAQQFGVSVDAAAAILQAATRGIKNPNLDILPKRPLEESPGLSTDGRPNSSLGSFSFSSRARSSTPKPASGIGEPSNSLSHLLNSVIQSGNEIGKSSSLLVAKAIAKTAAVAAATEADSSEASLTKEQKQKAERLKRAKMFAAIIKGGAKPILDAPLSSLSAEPQDYVLTGLQRSGSTNLLGVEIESREREGSSVPAEVDGSDKMEELEKEHFNERRSRKKHNYRSRRIEEDEDDDEMDHHKHSRKKHRSSRHSSHHDRDEHSHRKRHSSSRDKESRHKHRHHSSSEDEYRHRKSDRHRRGTHSGRKIESEDEDNSKKVSDRSNSIRISDSASRDTTPLVTDVQAQPSDTTDVPDDLRAKVRAMLLATM